MIGRERDRLVDRAQPRRERLAGQPDIRSKLRLSKPAARASRTAIAARAAEWIRPSRRSSPSSNDCTPKLMRLTPAARNAGEPLGRRRFRIGLERDLGVRRQRERVAARADEPRDFVGIEQRRRAAAEKDRVGRGAPCGSPRSAESRARAPSTYRALQSRIEQTAIEIAVAADRRAERDVEIEAEHAVVSDQLSDLCHLLAAFGLATWPFQFARLAESARAPGPGRAAGRRAAAARPLRFQSVARSSASAVGGQHAVVAAVVLEELAHFVQARVHPEADAGLERIELGLVGQIVVIRRENRRAPLVVAGIDDEVHRLFDPFGRLLRAEIVEDEQFGRHHRPEDVHLGGADDGVVGRSNHAQQIADVVEQPARASLATSRRSTETAMCVLPMPGGPMRQRPFCDGGKRVGESPRLRSRR